MDIKELYGPDVEIRKLKDIEVMTPEGFKEVHFIKRNKVTGYLRTKLSNDQYIECSESHKVMMQDGHFRYMSMLRRGDILQGNIVLLEDPEWIQGDTYLYDLLDVDGNIYSTTNGIVNHNCAFIDNIETTFAAAQPTLSTGGQVMLLSTPNGMGNFFHKMWIKAEMGENTFVPVRLPWQVHPERDQAWRDKQDADLGVRFAAQECDCNFLTSGDTVFETDDMTWYEETCCKDPVERRGVDSNLWIWEYPDYSRSYMVSADVARGDGSDYSAFHVWDVETCTQVAEYKGQMPPRDFGATLCGIASEYNNALLVCENANIGWSSIEEILARGYPNLYYSTVGNAKNETAESYLYKTETGKTVPGFSTNISTRPLVISRFNDFVHQRAITLQSKRLLLEMRTFIWKNNKAQAAQGYNDDLVMSAGIGLYVRETAFKLRQQGIDLTKASLSGFTNLNRRDPAVYSNVQIRDPYKIPNIHGNQEDVRWLLG